MNKQSLNPHCILSVLANEGDLQNSRTHWNDFQRDSENSCAKQSSEPKVTQSPAVTNVAALKWSLITNFPQRFLWEPWDTSGLWFQQLIRLCTCALSQQSSLVGTNQWPMTLFTGMTSEMTNEEFCLCI